MSFVIHRRHKRTFAWNERVMQKDGTFPKHGAVNPMKFKSRAEAQFIADGFDRDDNVFYEVHQWTGT